MNNPKDPEALLIELIDSGLQCITNRQIAKANKSFLAIYSLCREYPFILWDNPAIVHLAKTFVLMHHFDTFDEEAENIEIAHWAYLYAYRSLQLAEASNDTKMQFQALKDLVMIADECNECFTDSAARYYVPPGSDISPESRMMAARILPLVTYSFILQIEDRFGTFDNDEIIEEACNTIETEYGTISEKLTKDAENISKMIFNYILKRVQSKDFRF